MSRASSGSYIVGQDCRLTLSAVALTIDGYGSPDRNFLKDTKPVVSPYGPRVIVFLVWGDDAVTAVARCLAQSCLPDYPILLATDLATATDSLPDGVHVIRSPMAFAGKVRKSTMLECLPKGLQTILFLDADTLVIDDISLGFDMAEKHGIAMAPAPHYSLADFRGFSQIMICEGVTPRGQMLYNSGVIFFNLDCPGVREVFDLGLALAEKYPVAPWGDQPYLTLAMEMLGFNPYTLSSSFNHRGFGEYLSGSLRVWHSYAALPANAKNLEPGYLHRYEQGTFIQGLKVPL